MRKGEQTRQEIIRKAAPIFNQRGYDGAALSDLMRATGLEKGGIYRHFESKQQLAAEAFDYAWRIALDTRFSKKRLRSRIPSTARNRSSGTFGTAEPHSSREHALSRASQSVQ